MSHSERAQAAGLVSAFGCTITWDADRWTAAPLGSLEFASLAGRVTEPTPQLLRLRLAAILSAEIHPEACPPGPPWPAADGSRHLRTLPRPRHSE
jgi:hypothetical protein